MNTDPVHGQQEIHQRIMQLNFRDCKAKIRQVDAHATLGSGVVVQVRFYFLFASEQFNQLRLCFIIRHI